MGFGFIKRFLTNNNRYTISSPEYRTVYFLNVILVMLLWTCLSSTVTDFFFLKVYAAAAVNATAAVFSVSILIYIHKTGKLTAGIYLMIVTLFGGLAAFLFVMQQNNYSLFWICCVPPILFFLLNRKMARIITWIFSFLLLAFMFINFTSWSKAGFTLSAVFNISGAMLGLTVMTSYFNLIINEVTSDLESKNRELKSANDELAESKDQLRLILDSTAEAIYGIDLEHNCTFCNIRCIQILGCHNQDELLGKNMHRLIHHTLKNGNPLPDSECKIERAIADGEGAYSKDEIFFRADGTSFDVEYYSYPQYKNGKIVGAVVTFTDITERKKDEEKIQYLSIHDSLTGVFNRLFFEEEIKRIDTPDNLPVSVVFADVNGLKLTNDVFGHGEGDNLLIKCAEILKNACQEKDIIARVGGDEFIILLPNTSEGETKNIIEIITVSLARENVGSVKCSMALGYSTKTNINESLQNIIENAETEMYKRKILNRKSIKSDMINTIIETLHKRIPNEKQHSENVRDLCKKIGQALNLPETEIKRLKDAGYMHDIGKIVLDKNILDKKETLTDDEKKEMQQHSAIGYRILNLFDDTLDLAEGSYSHHERWDGLGYPKGIKGKEIPRTARIIAIAEAYDALTSKRFKRGLSKEAALEEIISLAGTKYDPYIVEVFVKMMRSNDN